MEDTKEESCSAELRRFRWAHANAISFFYGVFLSGSIVVGLTRQLLGLTPPYLLSYGGIASIVAFGILAYSVIPRLGFYLARHIFGFYYDPECLGKSYKAYRLIERRHDNNAGTRGN